MGIVPDCSSLSQRKAQHFCVVLHDRDAETLGHLDQQ